MRLVNGITHEQWDALLRDAKKREAERADVENWQSAPRDEGYNNN